MCWFLTQPTLHIINQNNGQYLNKYKAIQSKPTLFLSLNTSFKIKAYDLLHFQPNDHIILSLVVARFHCCRVHFYGGPAQWAKCVKDIWSPNGDLWEWILSNVEITHFLGGNPVFVSTQHLHSLHAVIPVVKSWILCRCYNTTHYFLKFSCSANSGWIDVQTIKIVNFAKHSSF